MNDMTIICSVDGCDRLIHARELCNRHYGRRRRNGDPIVDRRRPANRLKWLTEAISQAGEECIDWPFASKTRGYGYLTIAGGPKVYAHRVACSERYGPPPTSLHEAAHNCGRSSCVNPNHLRWATRRENHADMIEHGTMNYGPRNGSVKLTEDDVREIRRLWSAGAERWTQRGLSGQFGVKQSTISGIVNRRSWTWLA